jgi:AraC-like DNA-binding protein
MLLQDFKPSVFVSDFVQKYRIAHFVFDKNAVIPIKAYPPSPEHCLSFYPFDTEWVNHADTGKEVSNIRVAFIGQPLAVTNRIVNHNFLVLQIIFQPGALFRLLGIPASELTNSYINAEAIFSKTVALVNEQLFYASSYDAMIVIAENFVGGLMKKMVKDRQPIDNVCKLLLQSDNALSLDWLAKQAYLSTKQLERKFKERTGINPKLYQRVVRFDNAYRLKNSHPHLDWLRIAMACNYYDYQHLVKDYKDFTGTTPTDFHMAETKAPENILGLNKSYYATTQQR